jgi:hypothetical protein
MANVVKLNQSGAKTAGPSGKNAGQNMGGGESLTVTLPLMGGTVGPQVADVRALYKNHGVFTYDPGFMSTAACQSGITYIDGDKGELLYRGYPIEQLAAQASYLEVCYLLMFGSLPTFAQLEAFAQALAARAAQGGDHGAQPKAFVAAHHAA